MILLGFSIRRCSKSTGLISNSIAGNISFDNFNGVWPPSGRPLTLLPWFLICYLQCWLIMLSSRPRTAPRHGKVPLILYTEGLVLYLCQHLCLWGFTHSRIGKIICVTEHNMLSKLDDKLFDCSPGSISPQILPQVFYLPWILIFVSSTSSKSFIVPQCVLVVTSQ